MGTLKIVTGGQSLILTAVTTPAGDTIDLYSAATMIVTDALADPPVTGSEITLPLAFSTDQTLYGHDGRVVLTITQADGTTLYSAEVALTSGVGTALTTVTPAPTLAQVATDVYADHTAFVAKAIVDAKGDLITATAADTPARLAVGATDGTALLVKAANGTGLEWGTVVRPGVAVATGAKVLVTDGIGVGNSAAGSTPGSCVKKIQVFDAAGSSLGYLAVYDAIT